MRRAGQPTARICGQPKNMNTTEIPAGSIIVCNGPNGAMNAKVISTTINGEIVVCGICSVKTFYLAPSDVVEVLFLGEAAE